MGRHRSTADDERSDVGDEELLERVHRFPPEALLGCIHGWTIACNELERIRDGSWADLADLTRRLHERRRRITHALVGPDRRRRIAELMLAVMGFGYHLHDGPDWHTTARDVLTAYVPSLGKLLDGIDVLRTLDTMRPWERLAGAQLLHNVARRGLFPLMMALGNADGFARLKRVEHAERAVRLAESVLGDQPGVDPAVAKRVYQTACVESYRALSERQRTTPTDDWGDLRAMKERRERLLGGAADVDPALRARVLGFDALLTGGCAYGRSGLDPGGLERIADLVRCAQPGQDQEFAMAFQLNADVAANRPCGEALERLANSPGQLLKLKGLLTADAARELLTNGPPLDPTIIRHLTEELKLVDDRARHPSPAPGRTTVSVPQALVRRPAAGVAGLAPAERVCRIRVDAEPGTDIWLDERIVVRGWKSAAAILRKLVAAKGATVRAVDLVPPAPDPDEKTAGNRVSEILSRLRSRHQQFKRLCGGTRGRTGGFCLLDEAFVASDALAPKNCL